MTVAADSRVSSDVTSVYFCVVRYIAAIPAFVEDLGFFPWNIPLLLLYEITSFFIHTHSNVNWTPINKSSSFSLPLFSSLKTRHPKLLLNQKLMRTFPLDSHLVFSPSLFMELPHCGQACVYPGFVTLKLHSNVKKNVSAKPCSSASEMLNEYR